MSHPRFQAQNPRFSHDKFGWYACGPFSLAMGIEAFKGAEPRVKGKAVRLKTGDAHPKDGTNLAQLQTAAKAFDVTLTLKPRMVFSQLVDAVLGRRRPAVVGISYEPLHKTDESGDRVFTGNHYVLLLPSTDGQEIQVFDPLCDGRRNEIFLGSYSIRESLLATATSTMVLSGGTVGKGSAYVGLLPPLGSSANGGGAPKPHVEDDPPHAALPVAFRHGGEARFRGEYTCVRDVANIRGNPHVTHFGAPADNVVGHLRRDDSFFCAQTTEIGQKVAGSRRWHGDRAGDLWVHSSRVAHV